MVVTHRMDPNQHVAGPSWQVSPLKACNCDRAGKVRSTMTSHLCISRPGQTSASLQKGAWLAGHSYDFYQGRSKGSTALMEVIAATCKLASD